MTIADERAMDMTAWDGNAAMAACSSAADFRAICAGERNVGTPDERQHWALPHHKRPGALANAAGVRNALARLPQTQGLANAAAARRHLEAHMGQMQSSARPPGDLDVVRTGGGIELRAVDGSLGLLTGQFTQFGRWYPVRSRFEGDFVERVARGATLDTIRDDRDSMRVLFDHGMDPQLGNKVLGPIDVLEEKADGPAYEVPLFDTSYNRDLLPGLRAGVYGASMRMRVLDDRWDDEPAASEHNPDGVPERTITRMRVLEFGPVTFPANPGATAGVRSATDEFYTRMAEHNPPAFAAAVRAAGLSLEDFTGTGLPRRHPPGGHDAQPGHGRTSPANNRAALRDRAWRMRRQPHV